MKPDSYNFVPPYCAMAFEPSLEPLLQRMVQELEQKGVDFDTVVGIGVSGAVVVPALGRKLGKFWAIVRKHGEGTHHSHEVAGRIGRRWVFVDDFVASGETRDRAIGVVNEEVLHYDDYGDLPDFPTCFVGTLAYAYTEEKARFYPGLCFLNQS